VNRQEGHLPQPRSLRCSAGVEGAIAALADIHRFHIIVDTAFGAKTGGENSPGTRHAWPVRGWRHRTAGQVNVGRQYALLAAVQASSTPAALRARAGGKQALALPSGHLHRRCASRAVPEAHWRAPLAPLLQLSFGRGHGPGQKERHAYLRSARLQQHQGVSRLLWAGCLEAARRQ